MSERHFLIPDNDEGEWKYRSARDYLSNYETIKKAVLCPSAKEAMDCMNLSVPQFAKLLDVSISTVYGWIGDGKTPSIAQKLLILRALEIARKRFV